MRIKRSLLVSIVLFAAAIPPAAAATGDTSPKTVDKVVFDSTALAQGRRGDGDATAKAARDVHLQTQTRSGRLLDRKQVETAVVDKLGVATWEKGDPIKEARAGRILSGPASAAVEDVTELAFIAEEQPTGSGSAAAGGAGMGDASYSGGSKLTDYCQTWTYSGSSITGCQEKFKPNSDGSSSRDYYAYNRFATATGKAVSLSPDYLPVKIDIKTKPRKGYESRTKGLSGYFPHDSSQLCNEGSSVNITVGSLSLGIGLTNCADKQPQVNATSMTMGVIYDDGFIFGGPRTKGAEYEAEYWTYQGYAAPLLGDYNYAKFCRSTLADCTGTTGLDGW